MRKLLILLFISAFASLALAAPKDENFDLKFSPQEVAQAVDKEYNAFYVLPIWASDMITSCAWRSEKNSAFRGEVRILRGSFANGNRLFVQWIESYEQGQEAKVLSTRVIEELESQYQVEFNMPSTKLNKKSCDLTFDAVDSKFQRRYLMQIKLLDPGVYQFRATQLLKTE
ncbi:MAG: hypothetical protein WAO12_01415 [Venatoribacter sp.]